MKLDIVSLVKSQSVHLLLGHCVLKCCINQYYLAQTICLRSSK